MMKRVANVIEVGLRDGLQSHPHILSSREKLELINNLIKAGVKELEIASFVNPKLVPQLSDSKYISQNVTRYKGVRYSALVPNLKGYMNARECENISEIVLFASVSETFNQKNIHSDLKGAFKRFEEFVPLAKREGMSIRGSLSCCFDCPYEGRMWIDKVVDVVKMYKELGVDRIDIADTIGSGNVYKMGNLLNAILKEVNPEQLTGHFHDTRGNALSLVRLCLEYGITTFHSSIGGLGGCPFSNKIVGNLSTEDLVEYLHLLGYETGIDLQRLKKININNK